MEWGAMHFVTRGSHVSLVCYRCTASYIGTLFIFSSLFYEPSYI